MLISEGHTVRALVRPGSLRSHLADLPTANLEWEEGDITDSQSLLRSAIAGCRHIYHVAADYRLWVPNPDRMHAINVEGTRSILESARDAGVEKAVYCSSVAVLGTSPDRSPLDESADPGVDALEGHYRKTKYLGEKEALAANAKGFPVVVVNPSAPVGPWDVKPTPTGRIVLDFQRGKMPAFLDTGLNLVDVRDVAQGHRLAMEHGKPGERYILGNANLSLKAILGLLAEILNRRPPRIRIPHGLALGLAHANEIISKYITNKQPLIPLSAVRHAAHYMFYRSDKAIQELGFRQTPIQTALCDATRWFDEKGYVAGKPKY